MPSGFNSMKQAILVVPFSLPHYFWLAIITLVGLAVCCYDTACTCTYSRLACTASNFVVCAHVKVKENKWNARDRWSGVDIWKQNIIRSLFLCAKPARSFWHFIFPWHWPGTNCRCGQSPLHRVFDACPQPAMGLFRRGLSLKLCLCKRWRH